MQDSSENVSFREQLADLIDENHNPQVTEGGCDFRAFHRPDRPGREAIIDPLVDKILTLVTARVREVLENTEVDAIVLNRHVDLLMDDVDAAFA